MKTLFRAYVHSVCLFFLFENSLVIVMIEIDTNQLLYKIKPLSVCENI